MMNDPEFYAIILAAGKGKRMRDEAIPSEFPKVLRKACSRPLVSYVIDALRSSGVDDITVIVGFGADYVKAELGDGFNYVLQTEQLGSGHAVASAKGLLGTRPGHAIIMCGDSPLFTPETLKSLKETQASSGSVITLVSAMLDNPKGYGRIIRNADGDITGVIEEKCASEAEKAIREINGGAYAFDSEWLWSSISLMKKNDAGEYNLTDLVRIAALQGKKISSISAASEEVMGVNTPEELQRVEQIIISRAENKK